MVKESMDLLELLRKSGVDGDVDFLREALRVLMDAIMALCDAYGDGYSAGKETAYFEVRNWHPQQHAPSCGCLTDPCIAARSVMSKVR